MLFVNDGWMKEWMEGCKNGWMKEWMEGCKNGWMEEWIERCKNVWSAALKHETMNRIDFNRLWEYQ